MIAMSFNIRVFKQLLLRYQYKHNSERARMLNTALDFCRANHVEGDYFEFGVFRGGVEDQSAVALPHAFEARALRRRRIGTVHVRVGLPERYVFTAMNLIRQDLCQIAARSLHDMAAAYQRGELNQVVH